MNLSNWSLDNINYLRNVLGKVKKRLSGPESALFLREIFDREYYKINNHTPDAYYFGAVIKREEEKLDDFNYFKDFLEEYHKVGIRKYFGINILEYLDLTTYEKNILCDKAVSFAKEELEMAKQAARDNRQETNMLSGDPDFTRLFEGDI